MKSSVVEASVVDNSEVEDSWLDEGVVGAESSVLISDTSLVDVVDVTLSSVVMIGKNLEALA